MSGEEIFIFFILIPFIIGGISMAKFQRMFFNRYNAVYHPKDPVSVVDLVALFQKDPSKASKILKKDFFKIFFFRGNLYFKKYDDSMLNRYAFLVRLIFLILFLVPLLGISLILFK